LSTLNHLGLSLVGNIESLGSIICGEH
jgi:hypothetical protein